MVALKSSPLKILHFILGCMFITQDDVVSQRLGFGPWYFFIGVTNRHVFFNFPVSLGTRLKGRPEKLCDFIACNFESRAGQVGLNTNSLTTWKAKYKQEHSKRKKKRKQSFQPCLIRRYGLNLKLTQFSFYSIQEIETESPNARIVANCANSTRSRQIV